jgi:hypothetical protein
MRLVYRKKQKEVRQLPKKNGKKLQEKDKTWVHHQHRAQPRGVNLYQASK